MRSVGVLLLIMLAGCTGSSTLGGSLRASGGGEPGFVPMTRSPHGCSSSHSSSTGCMPITHVIVVMQENRSFVNLFAGYPGADAPMTGLMSNGQTINLNYTSKGSKAGPLAYSYVKRVLVKPYWTMAQHYVLADRMFATEHGSSWTAHLDLIGSTNISPTRALVDFPSNSPWDCLAPSNTRSSTIDNHGNCRTNGPRPCFTQFATMADTLDAAGLSWRFYAPKIEGDIGGIWSPFGAVQKVRYGPDWHNVVTHPANFLNDVARGDLSNVTWITPEWQWSDHAGGSASMGPSWVAAIVNAVGQSPFWNSTAIVMLWDDWGGFYDDAAPPQLDFKGLGLRVGCIIVSPYARAGYVSHTQYEFGSVNAFIEQVFGLPALGTAAAGYSDARAASIIDSFDFTQTPLTFARIAAPIPASQFAKMPESGKVPDDE